MTLLLATCQRCGCEVNVVRGDVMGLDCDGIICGPPRQHNPSAVLFPEYVSRTYDRWGQEIISPNSQCPSDWRVESSAPVIVDAPNRPSPLRKIAIVSTSAGHLGHEQAVRSIEVAFAEICVRYGCRRVGMVAHSHERGVAGSMLMAIRRFAERNPKITVQIYLCDRNDPRAYVKQIYHLFETNTGQ